MTNLSTSLLIGILTVSTNAFAPHRPIRAPTSFWQQPYSSSTLHSTTESNPATATNSSSSHSPLNNPDATQHLPIFQLTSKLAASALYQSNLKRNAKGTKTATGSSATNWIDDESSYRLRSTLDNVSITSPDATHGLDRDEAIAWLRWMKSLPIPLIVNLTPDLQQYDISSHSIVSNEQLSNLSISKLEFQSRLLAKLILFPSGAETKFPLLEPTGAIVFLPCI